MRWVVPTGQVGMIPDSYQYSDYIISTRRAGLLQGP